ncbi:5' nucleotidase, NT5C type [Actinomadura parmotrematis]|uniref:5'-nucleotidase n=1 Tax=Actinomadura parmotrematis TaxID=2864039 RepID=A0ABS7FPG0_9ACTN|nr:hypothetical protein [Actinomadura parmotrematis]MBW8482257.1 hypothetical protein [Actinomadura parmotrematis]
MTKPSNYICQWDAILNLEQLCSRGAAMGESHFIIGVDLDGVVADFYSYMRKVAAEWTGKDIDTLPTGVSWGLPEWGIGGEYASLHHFAVTQRELFSRVDPMPGAALTLREFSKMEDVRIRIITHRLLIPNFHKMAVEQTVGWLDYHGIPYSDLCFMQEKGAVGADVYLEDGPENIKKLSEEDKRVIIFSNSTNIRITDPPAGRAQNWTAAKTLLMNEYREYKSRIRGQELQ